MVSLITLATIDVRQAYAKRAARAAALAVLERNRKALPHVAHKLAARAAAGAYRKAMQAYRVDAR